MTVERDAYPRPPVRRRLAVWLRLWAEAIDPKDALPSGAKGHRLGFVPTAVLRGHQAYEVRSLKGAIVMGWVNWSDRWRSPQFKPAADSVFDKQALAEVYAQMRSL